MAARGSISDGVGFPCADGGHTRRTGASVASITERDSSRHSIRSCSVSWSGEDRVPVVPSAPSPSFASSFAPFLAHMPMWVYSTALATIVHRAHRQGFWEDMGLHWRALWHAFCREAGFRVATNLLVRDLLLVPPNDGRRLKVVVDGLPVYGGAQLAVDTTLVSALHCDGSARRGAAARDGVALAEARRCKERTCPELVQPGRRARFGTNHPEKTRGARLALEVVQLVGLCRCTGICSFSPGTAASRRC